MKSRPDSIGAPPVGAFPWFQLGIIEMGKSKVIKGKAQVFTQSIHVVNGVNSVIMGFTSWAVGTEPAAPLPSRNTCDVCDSFVKSAHVRVTAVSYCTVAMAKLGMARLNGVEVILLTSVI